MSTSRRFLLSCVMLVCAGVAFAAGNGGRYVQHNLVSDGAIAADHVDPNLKNAWGVAFNPFGFVWVADNEGNVSTLYDGSGVPQSLVVSIPANAQNTGSGHPTGIVFSGSNTDFIVSRTTSSGTVSGPARFIFATEEGLLTAWAPAVDGTHALFVGGLPGSVYKGLALAANGTGMFLYAADFAGGKIDVFDRTFQPATLPGQFVDPKLPKNYAPFNIQNIQGDLYVSFAKREPGEDEEEKGPGLGFVSVFDANGRFLRRVASRGKLNAPWGMALAPAAFGRFANQLLVGNFGDGTINAYDPRTGAFQGQLRGADNRPLHIDGLWGLAFGNGLQNQPTGTLFFAAGPNDEANGLYGSITPASGSSQASDGEDDD